MFDRENDENSLEMERIPYFETTPYSKMTMILVGAVEQVLFFHSVGNFTIPTDFQIFQRGFSTTNQILSGELT